MSNAAPPVSDSRQPPSIGRRLRFWFVAGFVIAFLSLLAFYPRYFYDGQALRQTVLWQYYLLEIQLALNSSGNIGPTSGNAAAALTTAATHLMISALVGVVFMGIGWATRKRPPGAN